MASIKSDEQEQTNVLIGMGAGGTVAAIAGGVVGAVTGGPVGAIAGATLGGMIGSVSGGAMAYGEVEPTFRHEYETDSTTARGTHRWEEISPAYRYGWESHDRPEYQGKAWSQVHADLEKGWTSGQWSAYEPHVRSAWERRAKHHTQIAAEPVATVVDSSQKNDPDFGNGTEELGSLVLGGSGGAILGSVMGLAVGGPIGMAIGGTLGTLGGAMFAQEVASDWHEPAFRAHHESFAPQGGYAWEEARPAYRYGWEANDRAEGQGKSWLEIRPELVKDWPGPGTFAEYETYIKEGWERRTLPKFEREVPDRV